MAINRKTFVAGEVLTASDVNNYLGKQAVVQVDSPSDLTTALATTNGVYVAYDKTNDRINYWDGTAWVALVITSDPSQGIGNKFAGYYYASNGVVSTTGASMTTLNLAYAVPFSVKQTTTFTRIAINCTALAGNISSSIRLGIYANNATGDYPDARILDAGIVSVGNSDVTGWQAITISQSLSAGLYWLVAVNQGAAVASVSMYGTASVAMPMPHTPLASPGVGLPYGWQQASVTGALPANWTTTKTLSSVRAPIIWLGL